MNEKVLIEARNLRAKFFKERRIELGMTQQELADKCGWQRESIARMEAAKFFINEKQMYILCNALDLYFFFEPKEGDTDLATMMKYRFQNGKPPSKN